MTAPEIDAADWLGLQPTHNPMRWSLPITPAISVRSRFLFGGAALGAATAALEATTGRPVVWATAQYLSFAPVGSVMDLDVHVSVASHRTTQARVIGHVGENEIVTVTAALGRRDLDLEETWPRMPAVLAPGECRPREHHHEQESLSQYLDQRIAEAPPGHHEGGPTGHGPGRICVWVLSVHPCQWYLLEIEAAGIRRGFGHGQLRIWSDDGHLQAIASQSVVVRERRS